MDAKDGSADERELDLVVWGATGFTGRLVAEYLGRRTAAAGSDVAGLRWALGGRDADRLRAVADELGLDVPVVTGDALDPASMGALAARTRAVVTTVGPYARYGDALVDACVAAGTHCCDLTGEVPWLRGVIDRHHAAARERGVRIVSMCGYDSVPSDLGCLVLQEAVHAATGAYAARVDCLAGPSKGGVSGGTIASAALMMERRKDPAVRRWLTDPGALTPGHRPPVRPDPFDVARIAGEWAAPWVMAGINGRVVHRTHQLLGHPWGEGFTYAERYPLGRGPVGWTLAHGLRLATLCFAGWLAFAPSRALLRRVLLPDPGEGPSEASRAAGRFRHRLWAADADGTPLGRLTIHADLDPGYVATAAMLAECGLATLAADGAGPAGVLTPGMAFGTDLVPRLEGFGMAFDVELAS